jgi:hypothetical protein
MPGQQIQVEDPSQQGKQQMLEVVLPPGVQPGSMLDLQGPNGLMRFEIIYCVCIYNVYNSLSAVVVVCEDIIQLYFVVNS